MADTPQNPINPSNFPNPGGATPAELANLQRKLTEEAKKLGINLERSYIDAYKKITRIADIFENHISKKHKDRFEQARREIGKQYGEEFKRLRAVGQLQQSQDRIKLEALKKLHDAEKKMERGVADETKKFGQPGFGARVGGAVKKELTSLPLVGGFASTLMEIGPEAALATGGIAALVAILGKLLSSVLLVGTQSERVSIAFDRAGIAQKKWEDVFSTFQTGQFANIADAQDIAGFVDTLSAAPRELGKASSDNFNSIKNFMGAMGKFGIPLEESVKMITAASRSWGGSTKDLNKQMVLAGDLSKTVGFDFNSLYGIMQDLDPAMKALTFSADNAGNAARMLAATFAIKLGKDLNMTQDEVAQASKSMGGFLESMSADKWAGIIAFTKGTMPDFQDVLNTVNDPMKAFSTYLEFSRKALANIPQAQRGFAVQGLAQQGLAAGALTPKGIATFMQLLQTSPEDQKAISKAMKDMEKTVKDANEMARRRETGLAALVNVAGTIPTLEKRLENLFVAIASSGGLTDQVHQLNETIAHPGRTFGQAVTHTLSAPTHPLSTTEAVIKKIVHHLSKNTSHNPMR